MPDLQNLLQYLNLNLNDPRIWMYSTLALSTLSIIAILIYSLMLSRKITRLEIYDSLQKLRAEYIQLRNENDQLRNIHVSLLDEKRKLENELERREEVIRKLVEEKNYCIGQLESIRPQLERIMEENNELRRKLKELNPDDSLIRQKYNELVQIVWSKRGHLDTTVIEKILVEAYKKIDSGNTIFAYSLLQISERMLGDPEILARFRGLYDIGFRGETGLKKF